MTKHKTKLLLSRETILTLRGEDLDGVHGGVTPGLAVSSAVTVRASAATVRVSARFCAQASKYVADKTANISVESPPVSPVRS
ncbi:MAG: hypothetical protein M4D80_04095 [Myxococcota bacterium]|nr:hypothetical protein [Deltaproteobacteria bacterium]MDQ3334319.1 hypothetical protein [Myxococcota bacterium]